MSWYQLFLFREILWPIVHTRPWLKLLKKLPKFPIFFSKIPSLYFSPDLPKFLKFFATTSLHNIVQPLYFKTEKSFHSGCNGASITDIVIVAIYELRVETLPFRESQFRLAVNKKSHISAFICVLAQKFIQWWL